MRLNRSFSAIIVVMAVLAIMLFFLRTIPLTLVGLNVVIAGGFGGYVAGNVFKAFVGAGVVSVVVLLPSTLLFLSALDVPMALFGLVQNVLALFVSAYLGARAGAVP